MSKHVTIINQYIGAPSVGMEYRHYYLAKNLQKLGYKVTLISGSYSHLFSNPLKIEKSFEKEIIDGIEYIWVKVPKYRSSKSLGRIWNMFYFAWKLHFLKSIPRSHIIVSSPSLFPVKFGKKLAKRFGTKFLFEVRDIWPLTLTELSNISINNPLIKLMEYYEEYAYKNADRLISLLPDAEKYFLSKGLKSAKFEYLPNGIEITEEDGLQDSLEVANALPKGKFIIAYVGTIGIANNLGYLVEAAKALRDIPDIHFVVLGQGGEKEKLIKKSEVYKLQNISFLDPIPKEKVGAFLKEVDVAFISLVPEKLFRFGVSPNKVFEYMYAKKPIVWAIEAGNNLIEEAKCGISAPLNDVDALKASILKLKMMSQKEREKLGQNGYNFVLANHSYKMLAKKLIKVIEDNDVQKQ